MHLYIKNRRVDTMICTGTEINSAKIVLYTFTIQKKSINEKIDLGLSGYGLCCPVRATTRRIKYLRLKGATCTVPIASIYIRKKRTAIKAKHITNIIRQAMIVNFHQSGILPDEVYAHSLRAGGAMAC
jgi:hypothetical protein